MALSVLQRRETQETDMKQKLDRPEKDIKEREINRSRRKTSSKH